MKNKFASFFLVCLVLAGSSWGQIIYVDGGVTNTLTEDVNAFGFLVGVGLTSSVNRLIIPDAHTLWSDVAVIGGISSANLNEALVTGGGSAWDVSGDFRIGDWGSSNRLDITEGGVVTSSNGLVGVQSTATDNVVVVTGSGSVWQNYGGLYIGSTSNSGNQVVVSDGGKVVIADGLFIDGSDNEFNLNDEGQLTVFNDFDTSISGFNFNDGGRLFVGGNLTGMTNALEEGRTLGLTGTLGMWNQSGNTIVVGGTSSNNTLSVENNAQVLAENIFVGSISNSTDNTVSVSSGGKVTIENSMVINGTNNAFKLESAGWLTVNADFDASLSGFYFGANSVFETTGILIGMTNSIEDGRSVVLTGSNAVWNVVSNSLYVGDSTAGNAIFLSNGAKLNSSNTVLGVNTSADMNQIVVQGAGSIWTNSGSLLIGGSGFGNYLQITNGGHVVSESTVIGGSGTGNYAWIGGAGSLWSNTENLTVNGAVLSVMDNAGVDVGQKLSLQNYSELIFSSGGKISASNYYQDASSVLSFDNYTNTSGATNELLAVERSAEFEANALVRYTGTIDELSVGVSYTNLLVTAEVLIIGGVTNDTSALAGRESGSLLTVEFYENTGDLYSWILRDSIANVAGFDAGSDMQGIADEIDTLAILGAAAATNQINLLNQMNASSIHSRLAQLYGRSAPTYAHASGMQEGFRQIRQRGVMPESLWPYGAQGPHLHGEQVQGWVKGYGSKGSQDGSGDYSAYDHSIYGMVVGVDKAFGDLLAGLAAGYTSSDLSQDDGDSSKANTGYGVVYASWGTLAWFADANLGYGRSSIENRSGSGFNTTADFNADQLGFYLGGGREFIFSNDRFFLTPSAGVFGSLFAQDAYTEVSSTAVGRKVDSYDRFSMQSELGVKVSYQREYDRFVLVPETHANWLHEFNSDEESIGYSLIGGTGQYTLGMQAPIEDLYEVGIGLSLWTENQKGIVFECAVGLDIRFGDGYSASALSGRVLAEF